MNIVKCIEVVEPSMSAYKLWELETVGCTSFHNFLTFTPKTVHVTAQHFCFVNVWSETD